MDIIDAFQKLSPISPGSVRELQKIIVAKHYPKGQHLLQLWEVDHYFHFIAKGSARVYYLREGNDITDYFALDGQFIGGLESLYAGKPSPKAIELTEDALVQSFNYHQFEALCEQYHDIERLGRKIVTSLFIIAQEVVEDLRFLSAAERYEQVEKRHPGISNRIPLKHIASYLNISTVSLSRIRSGKQ